MTETSLIGILSGKGGVGKTTTAINLACALSQYGRHAVLMDGDLRKPNIGLQLGMVKIKAHLHHALKAEEEIAKAVYIHPSGIQVIPGSIIYEEMHENHKLQFKDIVFSLKGKAEVIIIDGPPGFGKEQTEIVNAIDKAIIVTTPDLSSITDALKTKRLCKDKGVDILGIVITQIKKKNHETDSANIQTIFELPIIGEIPEDENVPNSQYHKYPVVYTHFKSPASIGYKKLAANLIGEPFDEVAETKESVSDYVLKKLGFK
jgi:septum site-determining protein MinD